MIHNAVIPTGMRILNDRPTDPVMGDYYVDRMTYDGYIFDGTNWVQISGSGPAPAPKSNEPTEEQLEKHPSLKQAWDEYMVIRRLLGL